MGMTSWLRCRRIPARPGDVHGELGPRAPAQALDIARHRLDDDLSLDVGEAAQLLLDDRGLETSLLADRDVLEVAATAQAGAGIRAGWVDALG